MAAITQDKTISIWVQGHLLGFSSAYFARSAQYQKRLRLVYAIAIVVGIGGYIGRLYPSAIATFGLVAIMSLGSAIQRSIDES